jgi:mono/diheme cytochrome c family protein
VGRPVKIALAVALVVVLLGAFALLGLVRRGFSTHEDPSAIEALIAQALRRWATPAELRDADNPLPLTPEVLAEARWHWADHCATCHGNDGKGDTTLGRQLYPRAPDMTLPRTQELSDGELFAIIENGIRLTGMPGWGDGTAESAYGSWSLVHFVRRLPVLTEEEIVEMEAFNPRSPEEWEEMRREREFLAGGAAPAPAPAHDGHGSAPHAH